MRIDNDLKLSPTLPTIQIWVSYVGNGRPLSQKSGTRRENINIQDFHVLSTPIPDDRGCLRSLVFISRESMKV